MQLVKGKVTINVNPKGSFRSEICCLGEISYDLKGLLVVERSKRVAKKLQDKDTVFHGSVLSQVNA